MKPTKAWAVVDEEGIVEDAGSNQMSIYPRKKIIYGWRYPGERIVRVEIREIVKKKRKR